MIDKNIRTLYKLYEIKGILLGVRPNSVAPNSCWDELLKLVNESISELRGED